MIGAMRSVTDQMGRLVQVPLRPSRIISLVPSQTELLFELGLDSEIVGVTKFCVHPAGRASQKQSIGGTKQFRFDVIEQLQPDLILGNKEENYLEGIAQLAASYPVWLSDIYTLDDALGMIGQVGELVGKTAAAGQLISEVATRFAQIRPVKRPFRVGYFIWQKPFMAVGQRTFIHDMLTRCGFDNAFATIGNGRYPELTSQQIQDANLDAIFLSSEPFPFGEKQRQAFRKMCPGTAVHLVDGELFSWYGSRLRHAPAYFQQLINGFAEQ